MILSPKLLVFILLTIFAPLTCAQAAGPNTPAEWYAAGQKAVTEAKTLTRTAAHAKNVILFVGDGMGISTITAARIFEGQLHGGSGEENLLSFEKLPYLAHAKTYSVDQQVPDSAPTMTAIVTGVKTNDGFIAVNQYGVRKDHTTVAGNELTTLLELAEDRGLSTGVVTTTRVTHATPAACYAHTVERDWEGDVNLSPPARQANFPDIARQLIEFAHGNGLEVALGGGRNRFLPNTMDDPEDKGAKGTRVDGRDLTTEWLKKPKAVYVWNKAQFDAVNPATTDHLLGLFEREHMKYEVDRATDTGGEPSLSEMTNKALDILAKNKKGFFLMVEGGRIDHAHHASNAYRALTETIAFSDAVRVAMQKTNAKETLIIVTADHSHVFTMAGYPKRGNPILGKVIQPGETDFAKDLLGLPYTTLSYANGPGYTGGSLRKLQDGTVTSLQPEGPKSFPHEPFSYEKSPAQRPDLTKIDTTTHTYLQESTIPLPAETHAGEDVAIFAGGPGASLFHGVQEQNVIFHVMKAVLFK